MNSQSQCLNDIVYVLKNGVKSEELRYSLRSLSNFPHGKVWFYGGKPEGLIPDRQVEFLQSGSSKYSKARSTFNSICLNDEITPDFWYFNDDFFCMHPIEGMPAIYDNSIAELIIKTEDKFRGVTQYSQRMRDVMKQLRADGYDIKNYAVHMPMLFNRKKILELPEEYDNLPLRQAYGNVYDIGGVNMPDVKIHDSYTFPDPDSLWLSTADASFANGKVGEYIRTVFKEPSKYETGL